MFAVGRLIRRGNVLVATAPWKRSILISVKAFSTTESDSKAKSAVEGNQSDAKESLNDKYLTKVDFDEYDDYQDFQEPQTAGEKVVVLFISFVI